MNPEDFTRPMNDEKINNYKKPLKQYCSALTDTKTSLDQTQFSPLQVFYVFHYSIL